MTSKETLTQIFALLESHHYSKGANILAGVLRGYMSVFVPDDDKDRIANKLIRATLK